MRTFLKAAFRVGKSPVRTLSSSQANLSNELVNAEQQSELYLTHVPVMAKEVMDFLKPMDGQKFIDMTFGAGGHSRHLLAGDRDVVVYALDRDPLAYMRAAQLATTTYGRVVPLCGTFSQLPQLLRQAGVKYGSINGILMDLGPSSMQLDDPSRGFTPDLNGPLDMRMDGNRDGNIATADDVINTLDANELARIFKIYGEEKYAKKFANLIIDSRFMMKRLKTTSELVQLITSVNKDDHGRATHSPAKVFHALRLFVNNELNELHYALQKMRSFLVLDKNAANISSVDSCEDLEKIECSSGRIAVLTYHSLEDRIVKRHFVGVDVEQPITKSFGQKAISALTTPSLKEMNEVIVRNWLALRKRVVLPTEEEILANVRAKDARLRGAMRIR